jgi:type VI secretion system protein ImpK
MADAATGGRRRTGGAAAPPKGQAPLALDPMGRRAQPAGAARGAAADGRDAAAHTAQHPNPAACKDALADGGARFEANARASRRAQRAGGGRALRAVHLLDQCGASTPWGGSGAWASHSLLVQFHNEAWGGEKVFQLMAKLADEPGATATCWNCCYVVLALGFEGRYRVLDNGRAQLDSCASGCQLLRKQAGRASRAVAALAGRGRQQTRLATASRCGWSPRWRPAAGSAFYVGAALHAERPGRPSCSPTFQALQAKRQGGTGGSPAAATAGGAAATPAGRSFLEPEIKAGLGAGARTWPTAPSSRFAATASSSPAAPRSPGPCAAAGPHRTGAQQVPGSVLITGHTDNQPIRSLRFPSNWHLSQDARRAVRDLLAHGERRAHEGRRAAPTSEPVADNATPAGRAQQPPRRDHPVRGPRPLKAREPMP